MHRHLLSICVLALLALFPNASAETLQLAEDAPVWKQAGAALLLYGHIGAGAIGLASGALAILSPKGRPVHRAAGKVFLVSMAVCYLIAAGVAPFLTQDRLVNTVAALMALNLLTTSWLAARRPAPSVGWPEWASLCVSLGCAGTAGFAIVAGLSVTESGAEGLRFVLISGALAALGDTHVLLTRSITGKARILRHLWRMCMSLFIAAGSFFFGQAQVLPEAIIDTPLQLGPALFPLLAIPIWAALVFFRGGRTARS